MVPTLHTSRYRSMARVLITASLLALASAQISMAPFTPGSISVLQVGSGTSAITAAHQPVTLVEVRYVHARLGG